jgi:glyoxylase-like metal-dependent hydrolase (beta-lactamase superfamily II)
LAAVVLLKTLVAAAAAAAAPQAERDLEVVDDLGVTLTTLLNTHCHADHITGTGKLKVCAGVMLIAPCARELTI